LQPIQHGGITSFIFTMFHQRLAAHFISVHHWYTVL